MQQTAADVLRPTVTSLIGTNPRVALRFWDGSRLGPADSEATIVLRSPLALRRMLWAPGELGASRAYVAGDIHIEGDIWAALSLRDQLGPPDQHVRLKLGARSWLPPAWRALRSGILGPPPTPPPEEARLHGRLHSKARDAAAIAHHYDVSNDFYRLVLGETLTYSCAYFASPAFSLDDAQRAKCDLVCRKLALEPGMRLLDVGCGWGTMVMHAAENYGVTAVGITNSHHQAELARTRVREAGLAHRVEIRLEDYREVADGPYDAVCSIGMYEHVGLERLGEYIDCLHRLLGDRGRLLNHGISRMGGPPALDPKSFVARYVFPDGALHEVGSVVSALQARKLEVRDVESLREHYALTLRHWVANLEAAWNEAVALVGANRARIWHLYMAGAATNFEANRTSVHQVLAVKTDRGGVSAMPLTRAEMVGEVSLSGGAARQPV